MNILVVADDSAANRWIIPAIEQHHALIGVMRPDWAAARLARRDATTASPAARRPLRERIVRQLRSRYFARRDASAHTQLEQRLFSDGAHPATIRAPIHMVSAWEINSPATQSLIEEARPDLLLVSGAPILRGNLYRIPPLGTVNLHFGISPTYRGMHTLETPWHDRDYAHIGATAHYINDGIDAGPILFRVYPAMQQTDELADVEARVVRGIASALLDFLTWVQALPVARPATGWEYEEPGRLVRFHDRRVRAELGSRLRRMAGARPPSLPGRVETFYG